MAEENISKQFFHIRDLSTKTVTLYPARAHIVREIPHISLAPGQNEVEIYGFATTIDEQSLQIEGLGDPSVAITDITVNQVPNKERFKDIYDQTDEDESDLEDYQDSDDDALPVKVAKRKYAEADFKLKEFQADERSAEAQLNTLDNYMKTVEAQSLDAKNFSDAVRIYNEECKRLTATLAEVRKWKEIHKRRTSRAKWEISKAEKVDRDTNKESIRAKKSERIKKARELQERQNEIARKREDLRAFWPANVYRVVVRLETSIDTPSASRRSSITVAQPSTQLQASEKMVEPETARSIALSISYVTTGSFWVPRYDLNISSVQKTSQITYRAEVRNGTTETWRDAKVVLSTSQTSYSGLEDKVPTMDAWQVTLNRYGSNDALLSNAEISHMEVRKNVAIQSYAQAKQKRSAGPPAAFSSIVASSLSHNNARDQAPNWSTSHAPQMSQVPQMNIQESSHRMARHAAPGGVVAGGSAEPAEIRSRKGRGMFGTLKKDSRRESVIGDGTATPSEEIATLFDQPELGDLEIEESAWEDYGLTATYELPGTRTLEPSSLARRHKIATLNATNIILNHIAVPKLRASAFLRAKIRNPSSSVTLLKGNAGITLDGSFLGNIPLQRVSPNQIFNIPLGVDPAIHISYPKPTLHRSTQGIFTKERAHVFSRSITVSNTKPVPIDLLILDQVPISQDERLRIDIIQPQGLSKEGNAVRCGQPANETNKKPWGKATATFRKDGEVAWTTEIEKGQACLFKFEYEAKMPSTEAMANA